MVVTRAYVTILQLFAARYLAKWTQSQLPRPTDRNTDRIHEWIQAVYEGKRFLDPERQYVPSQRAATKSSEVSRRALVGCIEGQQLFNCTLFYAYCFDI